MMTRNTLSRIQHNIVVTHATYLGERFKRDRKTWHVLQLELMSPTSCQLRVKGFVSATPRGVLAKASDDSVSIRDAKLEVRSRPLGVSVALIKAEVLYTEIGWMSAEIFISPMWEELI